MSARHMLILGGARSGKTGFAERIAMELGNDPAYLATSEALDEEMAERIRSHKQQRNQRFTTIEEPLALSPAIISAAERHDVVLVDCLTLWLSNLLGANADVAGAVEELTVTLTKVSNCRVILVSNEVGQGIVPDNALARSFRDLAGWTHQRMADSCADVYFIVAGLPMTLKGTAPELN